MANDPFYGQASLSRETLPDYQFAFAVFHLRNKFVDYYVIWLRGNLAPPFAIYNMDAHNLLVVDAVNGQWLKSAASDVEKFYLKSRAVASCLCCVYCFQWTGTCVKFYRITRKENKMFKDWIFIYISNKYKVVIIKIPERMNNFGIRNATGLFNNF